MIRKFLAALATASAVSAVHIHATQATNERGTKKLEELGVFKFYPMSPRAVIEYKRNIDDALSSKRKMHSEFNRMNAFSDGDMEMNFSDLGALFSKMEKRFSL